ncbi:MAG: hypothetical protein ACP5MD_14440, partial [Verrucomicrobiia bacterium]
ALIKPPLHAALPRLQCALEDAERLAKPKLQAWHFIQLTPDGSAVVTTLPAAREADTQELTKLAE